MVRVLSGIETPREGTVLLRGQEAHFHSPRDAMASGIRTVHQELTIVPWITVAENVTLGAWPTKKLGRIDRREQRAVAEATLKQLEVRIDVDALAGSYNIATQQLIEIARALTTKPSVLILDEPTSSLPVEEVDALLRLVKKLAAMGVAIIYVSHRMDELGRIADSVTVMRDGRVVDTLPIADAPVAKIVEMMVGPEAVVRDQHELQQVDADAPVVLRAIGVSDGNLLRSASFDLRQGEVLGIAGLLGSGRTELMKALVGLDPNVTGKVEINGQEVNRRTPRKMIGQGLTLVPEDRRQEGLVLILSVGENLWMSSHESVAKAGIINHHAAKELAERAKNSMGIAVSRFGVQAGTLSGGNQQKVVLGRCLNAGVNILLLDEPTRGIDVHAKEQIYDIVRKLSSDGSSIVFVSSEYEELLSVCHRILIMERGQISEEIRPTDVDVNTLTARLMKGSAA